MLNKLGNMIEKRSNEIKKAYTTKTVRFNKDEFRLELVDQLNITWWKAEFHILENMLANYIIPFPLCLYYDLNALAWMDIQDHLDSEKEKGSQI